MDSQPISKSLETDKNTQVVHHSRVGMVWISLAIFMIVLLLLILFMLQNSKVVQIHYFGARASISFGIAILLAVVAGSILTLLIGTTRIIQLKLQR